MRRRTLFPLLGSTLLPATALAADDRVSPRAPGTVTLLTAPIEAWGDWGGSLPHAALTVVSRMRQVCLAGIRLVSDRQPELIRVDNRSSGPPHIWLHFDGAPFAWLVVDIGPRDWSKLAYQFGHEFGHVVCNLWRSETHSPTACGWLEEALVEAFAIRGLGLLARSWALSPPFPGDAPFANAIRQYRGDLVAKYRTVADEQGPTVNLAVWYRAHRGALEANAKITGPARGAVLAVLGEMMADPTCLEGLGGLYRWPDRDDMPLQEYLELWQRSCADLDASRRLPIRLRRLLFG